MFDFLKKKLNDFAKVFESKVKVTTEIKKTVIGETGLSEAELNSFLFDFELALVESDVAMTVAQKICAELRPRLAELKFKRGENIEEKVRSAFRGLLDAALSRNAGWDMVERVRAGDRPVKILFLGPNGSGKTTTIAKIANLLISNNVSCVIAAADTFRAASIEQLEQHGSRLGVKVIKHGYGSDPAAVAFDAVKYASSKSIDCVLIDTAGRQETNANLVEQIKKISRVVNPDLRIFIGEAIVGNAIMEQIGSYRDSVGLDGAILTKLDLDVKGGAILTTVYELGVPVLYFGMGQEYSNLQKFDKDFLLGKIFEAEASA